MNIKTKLFAAVVLSVLLLPAVTFAQTASVSSLQAELASLMAQVQQLEQQLAAAQAGSGAWCHTFSINLSIGASGTEVQALQQALSKDGETITMTGMFDDQTASAVTGFQQKYASQILTPNGLQYGTGYVGISTRAELDALYGCSASATTQNTSNNTANQNTQTSTAMPAAPYIASIQGYNPSTGNYTTGSATQDTELVLNGSFGSTSSQVDLDSTAANIVSQTASQITISLDNLSIGSHSVVVGYAGTAAVGSFTVTAPLQNTTPTTPVPPLTQHPTTTTVGTPVVANPTAFQNLFFINGCASPSTVTTQAGSIACRALSAVANGATPTQESATLGCSASNVWSLPIVYACSVLSAIDTAPQICGPSVATTNSWCSSTPYISITGVQGYDANAFTNNDGASGYVTPYTNGEAVQNTSLELYGIFSVSSNSVVNIDGNSAVATVTYQSPTQINISLNGLAVGFHSVTVTANGMTSKPEAFAVIAHAVPITVAPVIANLQPYNPANFQPYFGAAPQTAYLAISGTFAASGNIVKVDGNPVSALYQNISIIDISLASISAGSHTVSVVTGGVTSNSKSFSVATF